MKSPQEHVTHGPTSVNGILKSVVIHPGEYMFQFLGRQHGVVRYLVVMTLEHSLSGRPLWRNGNDCWSLCLKWSPRDARPAKLFRTGLLRVNRTHVQLGVTS